MKMKLLRHIALHSHVYEDITQKIYTTFCRLVNRYKNHKQAHIIAIETRF